MPVGCYSGCENITSTCGLCSDTVFKGEKDVTLPFFHPDRFPAQRICSLGFGVSFSFAFMKISSQMAGDFFETCSEAPMYRTPWEVVILMSFVNGKELGIFESPCDCGVSAGAGLPSWISVPVNQYVFLKKWRGMIRDVSGWYQNYEITIIDINFSDLPYISVKSESQKRMRPCGGINIFERNTEIIPALSAEGGYQLEIVNPRVEN